MQIILEEISSKIYTIRAIQVMLDRDLAELYQVETKHINQAVRNNPDKFPEDFYFELKNIEFDNLRSKILTANISKIRTNPKVFTEQGIYMLATILKSKVASDVTISLIKTFAKMRKFLLDNASIFQRFDKIEQQLLLHNYTPEVEPLAKLPKIIIKLLYILFLCFASGFAKYNHFRILH